MTDSTERLVRWEPLAGLPEQMLGTVAVVSDGKHLTVTAFYDDTALSPPVKVDFGTVEAFKVYEEFSDFLPVGLSPKMAPDPVSGRAPWPFQEVKGSGWIRRVTGRNGALNGRNWRHFCLVTVDVFLHVMTDEPFQAVRLAS
jgi:hypothetical protein